MARKKKPAAPVAVFPEGFVCGGIPRRTPATGDQKLAMLIATGPRVAVAALTTTNRFAAPPILLCRDRLKAAAKLRGVVVNSGNANAATGARGMKDARAMARAAESATGLPAGSFLVASTGVIGKPMAVDAVARGIARLAPKLSSGGWDDFAASIMTTDLVRKVSSRRIALPGGGAASIIGIAKGSGMIQPDMATMLAFIATDFPVSNAQARKALRAAADVSFHCLTVDGQTSTNDMVTLISSGAAAAPAAALKAVPRFEAALTEVCQDLTRKIAADGEGATKLVTIDVSGAKTREDCRKLALEVGNSDLVKTALHGGDPNWGRIAQALGKAGVLFDPARVSIWCQGVRIMARGGAVRFSRPDLRAKMQGREIHIEVEIGRAPTSIRVWTCDLGYGYIDINTAYN
jgi:glutamate N-acetyltransferase / amino-acid N-acetyltransferase